MILKMNWAQAIAITSQLTVLGLLFIGFQNCSKVGFESNDELVKAGIDGELRMIRLDPETVEDRPKINLTVIADNSQSMAPIQNQVADALSKVSDKLRGFDGGVEIYTTTQDSEDKSSLSSESYIEYLDDTDMIRLPAGDEDSVPITKDFVRVTSNSISAPWSQSRQRIQYSGTMTDSEFNDFKTQVSESIRALGVDGSDNEQGLCSLMRAIEAKDDPEAFEAFLLVANEDDATTVSGCLEQTRQEVKSNRVESTPHEECDAGDPECRFTYKVSYRSKKKETLTIKGRKISQKVFYKTEDVTRNDRIDYNFWRHRARVEYFEKRFDKYVTFTKLKLVDNLPTPEDSPTRHYFNDNTVGTCDTEYVNQPVECSAAGIPGSKIPFGYEEGTCSVTCVAVSPRKMTGPTGPWQGGKCPAGGLDYGRSALETWLIGQNPSYNLANLDNYQTRCQSDSEEPADLSLSAQPSNCGSNSCTNEQESAVLAKIRSLGYAYIDAEDIDKCKVKCSESNVGGSFNWNTNLPDICPGANEDQNVTKKNLACDAEMLAEALDRSGKASTDDITCNYQCKQEMKSSSILMTKNSMCTATTTCIEADAEYDTIADKLEDQHGLGRERIADGSCKTLCQNGGASKGTCEPTLSESGQCSGGLPGVALEGACPSGDFEVSDCRLQSALKPGFEVNYNRVPQPVQQLSLFDSSSKVSQVVNALNSKLNEGYFLASFVVPPGDESCQPESEYIDPANTYNELHQQIGNDNGRLYPICMSDYSPALDFSLELIVKTVKQSYILEIDPEREFIWKLYVSYKDGRRELLDKSLYSLNQRLLTFSQDVDLSTIEALRIEVVTENL
jgi:hypothetical protein